MNLIFGSFLLSLFVQLSPEMTRPKVCKEFLCAPRLKFNFRVLLWAEAGQGAGRLRASNVVVSVALSMSLLLLSALRAREVVHKQIDSVWKNIFIDAPYSMSLSVSLFQCQFCGFCATGPGGCPQAN